MPTPPSDGEIVSAVLGGERERFGELARRYQSALLRAARSRLGRQDWAEDAVQEAFYCALKSLHAYNSAYSFRTWLWTILLNQCRRIHQKRRRRPQVTAWSEIAGSADSSTQGDGRPGSSRLEQRAISSLTDQNPAPPDQVLARERAELLDRLLGRLPAAQADALRLRFFGGLKFHEIAAAMECSLSTAKNRVRWGLEKMSQMMNDAALNMRQRDKEKP